MVVFWSSTMAWVVRRRLRCDGTRLDGIVLRIRRLLLDGIGLLNRLLGLDDRMVADVGVLANIGNELCHAAEAALIPAIDCVKTNLA